LAGAPVARAIKPAEITTILVEVMVVAPLEAFRTGD
jgi:hypothetical protein